MAHADYNCCAICDDKMYYAGFESETKEEICDACLNVINEMDLNISNVEELKKFIESGEYEKVKELLINCGFWFCYYGNEIDKSVLYRFFNKHISFQDFLELLNSEKLINEFVKQLDILTNRNYKAIEYLKGCGIDEEMMEACDMYDVNGIELLKILEGNEKESEE